MNYTEQKALYESIMKEVSKTLKKMIIESDKNNHVNELSFPLMSRAYKKLSQYGSHDTEKYEEYMKTVDMDINDPIVPYLNHIQIDFSCTDWTKTGKDEEYSILVRYCNSENTRDFIEFNTHYVPEIKKAWYDICIEYWTSEPQTPEMESIINSEMLDMISSEDVRDSLIRERSRLMSKRDAIRLQNLIMKETGIDMPWRMFGLSPEEYKDTIDDLRYYWGCMSKKEYNKRFRQKMEAKGL